MKRPNRDHLVAFKSLSRFKTNFRDGIRIEINALDFLLGDASPLWDSVSS